jgi:YgiT-type zinc finger domain-containing protein
MKENNTGICPICKGTKRHGTTTFTADLGFGVVVIRNVPAWVCSQCGADWIEDPIAERIEHLVEEARAKRSQVEVVALP